MKFLFVGDSWATKGFTEDNYRHQGYNHDDMNLADYWNLPHKKIYKGGSGNLEILDIVLRQNSDSSIPIIWVYTEPGRDYKLITGNEEFEWMRSEDIFSIRQELDKIILTTMRLKLDNPVGLIGGLSDVTIDLAKSLGFTVLHDSWQRWISDRLGRTEHFKFGWGASDIGWRMDYNNVKPSKAAVFAWDDLIKEWCMWEELGYFCHEHPTPMSNEQFANYLKPAVIKWLEDIKK